MHGAPLFFFEAEGVDDFFVDSQDHRVGEVAVCVGLGDDEAGFIIVALVNQPTRRFGAANQFGSCDMVRLERETDMNGRMRIHITEKIPWKSDGALHAQVDAHCPVPRVIPAAINAPTLEIISLNLH
jgi:hypothetical protein